MADPILTFPKKISFKPTISNSVTLNEDDSFKITVELSLYWIVTVESSFVKISSCKKTSSYKSSILFSPLSSIA